MPPLSTSSPGDLRVARRRATDETIKAQVENVVQGEVEAQYEDEDGGNPEHGPEDGISYCDRSYATDAGHDDYLINRSKALSFELGASIAKT